MSEEANVEKLPVSLIKSVYLLESDGELFSLPQNNQDEFYIPEPDLNMVAIESINDLIENYYQNSRGMDFNWQKTMAQTALSAILNYIQENL